MFASPSSTPLVSVVVPVRNAKQFLEACIDPILRALESCSGELIIIDNGSIDGSYEMLLERWNARASVHLLPGPTIGAVRNYGARLARAEILSFIDSDCVVPPNYFVEALAVLDRTGAAATGSTYALPGSPHWIERVWHELHHKGKDGEVAYLNAGNFICRRSAFESVGGFDEEIITGEDAELCERLRAAGHPIHEARSVVAVHLGNPKSIGHFFRKQRWHGLGMLGTFRQQWLDRPVIMTVAHLLSMVAAIVALVASGGSPSGILLFLILMLLSPAAAVAYRVSRNGRPSSYWRAILLYHLYFDARIAALLALPLERRRMVRLRERSRVPAAR